MLQERMEVFRDKKGKKPPAQKVWRPVRREDLLAGRGVQSYDQSLTSCGCVQLVVSDKIWVLDKYMIKPPRFPHLSSFAEDYERAHWLRNELGRRLPELVAYDAVMEMPVVGGHRTQSILLAGDAVWDAVRMMDRWPTMVSKNHVGTVLCGDKNAPKAVIKEAVVELIPEAASRDWNEHLRDAAAIALTYLYDLKREEDDADAEHRS